MINNFIEFEHVHCHPGLSPHKTINLGTLTVAHGQCSPVLGYIKVNSYKRQLIIYEKYHNDTLSRKKFEVTQKINIQHFPVESLQVSKHLIQIKSNFPQSPAINF